MILRSFCIQGVCIDETDVRTVADKVRHRRTSVRRSKQTPDAELPASQKAAALFLCVLSDSLSVFYLPDDPAQPVFFQKSIRL